MRQLFYRKDWHAAPPAGPLTRQGAPVEAFLHHGDEEDARRIQNFEAQCAAMRGIQRLHTSAPRHWSDIAYHWVVFQTQGNVPTPRAFKGRDSHIVKLLRRYKNLRTLGGHGDVVATTCPGPNIRKRIPTIARRAGLRVF
jgi:hypothetical protein